MLLVLQSTPTGPNMPSPWEILRNRTFQCPSKPSISVDMECICNYLVSKSHSQKQSFDRAQGDRELKELQPSQEVLFLSPIVEHYILGTIIDKATMLHSYIIEVQGKKYCRAREHIKPMNLNIPLHKASHQQQPKPCNHTSQPSCIPKLQQHLNLECQPIKYLPKLSLCPSSHTPIPQSQPKHAPATNAFPGVNELLCHLSTLSSPAPSPSLPVLLKLPSDTQHTNADQCSKPSYHHRDITTNQFC